MKRQVVSVGVIFCLSVGFTAAAGQATWKEFQSKEGGFKILLPGTPKEQKMNIPLPNGGTIEQRQFLVDAGSVAHVMAFQDNAAVADDPEKALGNVRDAVAKNFMAKVQSSKSVKLSDKYPGLEFLIESPQPKIAYRSRAYLVGKRLYQVSVVGPMAVVTSAESDRYFDSFALTK